MNVKPLGTEKYNMEKLFEGKFKLDINLNALMLQGRFRELIISFALKFLSCCKAFATSAM